MRTLLFLIVLFSGIALAEEFAIVSNKQFPLKKLNARQIKQIYLKRLHYIDNIKLLPVNLSVRSDLRKTFEDDLLQMSQRQLKQYWTKAHYQGERPPIVKHSIQSAIALVREIDGAIAYIPHSQAPKDLIVLYLQEDQ